MCNIRDGFRLNTSYIKKPRRCELLVFSGGFLPPFYISAEVRNKTMKEFFTTKRLCRAGVIAALYVAMTYAFGAIAYDASIVEIRPAEALTILPLFFSEAVPALWIGCMLANLGSQFIAYDVPLGGLATLIAALCTYGTGRLIKNHTVRVAVGGIFPVLVNAFAIPFVIILCGGAEGFASTSIAYWTFFASLCATQALWVYGLGIPLYVSVYKLRQKGVTAFIDAKKQPPKEQTAEEG